MKDATGRRLCLGFLAIGAFVAAGFVRLSVGLPAVVYLPLVTVALAVFIASLIVPDDRSSRLSRQLAIVKSAHSLSPNVGTEVLQ